MAQLKDIPEEERLETAAPIKQPYVFLGTN
jgi:hypothetical protein